jgi:uncharacterized membrane protein YhaH (DUF805 family)
VRSPKSLGGEVHELVQALVLHRGIELVQQGLRPPADVVKLPPGVWELVQSSPSHLNAALNAANTKVETAQANLRERLRRLVATRSVNWTLVDGEAEAACPGPSDGGVLGDARQQALECYWLLRSETADEPLGRLRVAVNTFVETHVRVSCLAELENGKRPSGSIELQGEQIISLGEPGGVRKLYMDAANELIRHQDAMVGLVRDLAERAPHALAVCDRWITRTAADAEDASGDLHRRNAVLCIRDIYFELRRRFVHRPVSAIGWLFTWQGHLSRLQYFIPALSCEIVFIALIAAGRSESQRRSNWDWNLRVPDGLKMGDPSAEPTTGVVVFLGTLLFFAVWWIGFVFAVRRIRDMNRSPLLCLVVIFAIKLSLRAGLFVGGSHELMMIGSGLAYIGFEVGVLAWLFFSPSRTPRLIDALGNRYSVIRWGNPSMTQGGGAR